MCHFLSTSHAQQLILFFFSFLLFILSVVFRWIAREFRANAIIWSISWSDFWRGTFCVRQSHVMHSYNLHFIQREKWKINRFVANAVGMHAIRCTGTIERESERAHCMVASDALHLVHTLLPFVQVSMVMRTVRKMSYFYGCQFNYLSQAIG